MTDTTDIKALSYARLQEIKSILSGFEDGYDTVDDKENYEAMRGAQLLIDELISLRDQLEAERQRADSNEPVRCEVAPQHVHAIIDLQETIDELRAELAALKGDQVPVEYQYQHTHAGKVWLTVDKPDYETFKKNGWPTRELFTAPQKPVVLPSPYYGDRHCLDKREVIAAIEAAGGKVITDEE